MITHFHSDHIGSLPSLLFYVEFFYRIKPTIIYPEKEKMEQFLKLSGNHPEWFNIVKPDEFKNYRIEAVQQLHSDYINAYGYIIEIADKIIYYSGDSKNINENVLYMFINGQIDYFYQDVSRYETSAHMNIEDLAKIIPENRREDINCMHFDDKETQREILKKILRYNI